MSGYSIDPNKSIADGEFTWKDRDVSFQEFIQLTVESGSKEKWFNCPEAWEISREIIEQKYDRSIEQLQEESWRRIKEGIFNDDTLIMPVIQMRCTLCMTGHMLECHYPHYCEEGVCSRVGDEL